MAEMYDYLGFPAVGFSATDLPEEYRRGAIDARRIFIEKLGTYGASWLVFRPSSITDQALIKAYRLRKLHAREHLSKVGESVRIDALALINYSFIAVYVAHKNPLGNWLAMPSTHDALDLVVQEIDEARAEAARLFVAKNHDYDQAWQQFRVETLVDLILAKFVRIRQLESTAATYPAAQVRAEFLDIANYACLLAGLMSPQ
ncbi:DUF1599 domain-containing protein [Myxococcus faecalis]|uniref:DUF1599 domain-containing protein n=1 Tax=Myxococcus faecalis TaxID=3115646 RepID=UPI003CF8A319